MKPLATRKKSSHEPLDKASETRVHQTSRECAYISANGKLKKSRNESESLNNSCGDEAMLLWSRLSACDCRLCRVVTSSRVIP